MTTAVQHEPVTLPARPGFEGANIRTWIGFKHFAYLVEQGVLQWFRERDHGPGRLYLEHGVGLSVRECSLLLPAVLEVDDEVSVTATPGAAGRFAVRVTRVGGAAGAEPVTACRARVRVALVREPDAPASAPLPADLAGLLEEPGAGEPGPAAGADPAATLRAAGAGFVWAWRVPYFYCQYSQRMQHAGYVRLLEEVVDRYLADRGLSVGRMLRERGWIPVVSRARVEVVGDARVEEPMWVTFTVTDVLKDVTYDARMTCHVLRDGRLTQVASATILHGYAASRGPDAGSLATLDPETVAALTAGCR
ncbi:thioesterase family protein [Micromonospora sp. WMMD980]|uniref:thioesterase family protein n=1 Tax=Micromonospora sp. WMMD980 TaxID=3016088 RepID=UPI002415C196|nr:thioesterase family protein [Micromonospora sp. WMMD980]MDG4800855.1 thioesterase family protein [Micromonospora sp. WMMD980]